MTVGDFYEHTSGVRRFSFDDTKPSMCGHDFWRKYSGTPEWNAEIANVDLIPKRDLGTGDVVICLIALKKA